MDTSTSNISKIENFLTQINRQRYPGQTNDLNHHLLPKMISMVMQNGLLAPESRILDVGCGQGEALEIFTRQGFSAIGITAEEEDVKICRQKGFEVYEMDPSFLNFDDNQFDFIWCRHTLARSIFPFFTLSEFFRVLRPEGRLYIEVPAPDTSGRHQANKNHYSVLGKSMWRELITRTGFIEGRIFDIEFDTSAGPDKYFSFIQQKPRESRIRSKRNKGSGVSIREKYRLYPSDISRIDLANFSKYVANQKHRDFFFDIEFKEHYRLIAYLSTFFNDSIIFDIGTNLGYSALALAYNNRNRVVSYDIVDLKELNHREELTSIEYLVGDVLQDNRLMASPLIMLDTYHDGSFEKVFYTFLKQNRYRGLLFLDDIRLNQPMRDFWNSISEPKEDITDVGHWSGSGLVDFGRD